MYIKKVHCGDSEFDILTFDILNDIHRCTSRLYSIYCRLSKRVNLTLMSIISEMKFDALWTETIYCSSLHLCNFS
jgi:hypothetical protein